MMSVLRVLLFENLGLKFIALLLSILVYFNARTDRPMTMRVSFPIALQDLPDSLTLAGPAPAEVRAVIRGTGKSVIALQLSRPQLVVPLARARTGQFQRSVHIEDLPLPPGLEVDRLVGPRMIVLEIDRRLTRLVPAAARLEWAQPSAARPVTVVLDPKVVTLTGPARIVSRIDTLPLAAVRVDARHDTLRAEVGPVALPERVTMEPAAVRVTVALTRVPS